MSALTSTGKLIRLILRRDRLLLPLWVVPLGLIPISIKSSIAEVYPTAEEVRRYAETSADTPGFITLYGRVFGTTLGEMTAWRLGFVPVIVALLSLLMVIRHTRTDEEAGRRELVNSTVVGRHAGLAAALVVAFAANLLLAVLIALLMSVGGMPSDGSWALSLEFAAAGWIFAGIGAVAAQLTESAGTARGIAISVLGAAFLLRVVGDIGEEGNGARSWVSWLSPIGWVHRIHPYGDERWWLVLLAIGVTAALAAVAVALSARRDIGAGLLPARPGPAEASPSLRSPLALAWRLHRALLAAWVAGFVVLGVVLGGVAESIGGMMDDNKGVREIFTRMGGRGEYIDSYIASIMILFGIIVAAYAIQAALRMRAEESSLRAEPVLATSVSRLQWATSHLVFSILGPAAALVAAGLATGLTHGLNTGDVGRELPRVLGAAVVQLPAVWVLSAIAVALVGLLPRLAAASWGSLAICLVLLIFGAALQLGQWLMDISPFTHVPKLPVSDMSVTPVLWLLAVAVVVMAVGLAGLRRRDIAA